MMAVKQAQMGSLMRDVLGESYVSLDLRGVDNDQRYSAEKFILVATLVDSRTGIERYVRGEGLGVVGVAFNALVQALLDEYPSLESLQFHSFELEGFDETDQSSSSNESLPSAHLSVNNQVGHTFRFSASSRSVMTACIQVALLAVEYFINSEQAFYRIRGFLDEAKANDRPDLVDRYTHMLTQLVMNSLYSGLPKT